jgi:chaperonin GroEL (HSP60 family)
MTTKLELSAENDEHKLGNSVIFVTWEGLIDPLEENHSVISNAFQTCWIILYIKPVIHICFQ